MADKTPKDPAGRIGRPAPRLLTPEEEEKAAAEIDRRKSEIEAKVRIDRDTIVGPSDSTVPNDLPPAQAADAKVIEDRLKLIRAQQRADADSADAPTEGTPGEATASVAQQRQEILDRLAEGGIVVRPVIGAEPLGNADVGDLVDQLAEKEFVAGVTGQDAAAVSDTAFGDLIKAGNRTAVEDILNINLDDLTPVGKMIVAGQVRSGGAASSHFDNLLDDIVGGTNTTGFFKPGVIPGFGNPGSSATTAGTGAGTGTGTASPPASGDSGSGSGSGSSGDDGNDTGDGDGTHGRGVPDAFPGGDDGGDDVVTGGQDDPEGAPPGGDGDGGGDGGGGDTGGQDDPEGAPPSGEGGGDEGGGEDTEGSDEDDEIVVTRIGGDTSSGRVFEDEDEDEDEDDDEDDDDDDAGGGVETSQDPDADTPRPKGTIVIGGAGTVISGLTGGDDVDPADDGGTDGGTPTGPAVPRVPSIVNPGTPDDGPLRPANPVRLKDPGNIDPTDDDTAFGAGAKGGGGVPTGPSVAAAEAAFDGGSAEAVSFDVRDAGVASELGSDIAFGSVGTESDGSESDDDDLDDS